MSSRVRCERPRPYLTTANAASPLLLIRSDLWTRQTDGQVLQKFGSITEAIGGDEEAAADMLRKCKMLFQLPTEETLEMLDKWVEHFGGDKAGAVDTLRKNPNLLLSEPSGPVEVTKALASFASLFDF